MDTIISIKSRSLLHAGKQTIIPELEVYLFHNESVQGGLFVVSVRTGI